MMLVMIMNKVYEDLILKFTEEIFKRADKACNSIYKMQAKDLDDILNKIANVLLKYTISDSNLDLSDREKAKLRKEFNSVISNISDSQFKNEKGLMENILETSAKDKYYTNTYVMEIGISFKLQRVTDKQIKEIVDKAIKGELWSDRLWDNKKELEKNLNIEIERFLTGKTNVNKIKKVVKDRFNQNAYNTRRLVQTEVAKCQNEANNVFAQEHGVSEQMFTATLDNRTSNFCRKHDGEIYKIDDVNKPFIPVHPFCRSCYINIPYVNWQPKSRKDNITKENIDYKTYNEWLKQKNI